MDIRLQLEEFTARSSRKSSFDGDCILVIDLRCLRKNCVVYADVILLFFLHDIILDDKESAILTCLPRWAFVSSG